jgi:hypothetical protein
MPLLVVFVYILLAGIGLPYALHASSLLGQIYQHCMCELTNQRLILAYTGNASFAFILCFLPVAWALRLQRFQSLTPISIARLGWFTGLLTAYVALHLNLTAFVQVFGSDWNQWSAFVAMVIPKILAILPLALLSGHLGAKALLRLHAKLITPSRNPLSA